MFRTLLEWTRRIFLTLHEFRNLDSSTLLTIIWLHAGRLHQVLALCGADNKRVRVAFGRATDAFGMVPDHSRSDFWQDAAHPRRAARLTVIVRGLGSSLQALPSEIATPLREQIITSLTSAGHLTNSAAGLLHVTSGLPNALGSFLGGDGYALLGSAFGLDTRAAMLPQSPTQMVTSALAQLATAPEDLDAWKSLVLSVSDLPLPTDLASTLNEFLTSLNPATVERLLHEREANLLPFLSARCALMPSSAIRELCKEFVFKRARQAVTTTISDKPLRDRTRLFAGCLVLLAVVPGDEAATHEGMHKLLVRLLQECPAVAPILRQRFDGWPTNLPLVRQRGYWELEMTLRALL
jgi:hypothetical protein